MKKEQAIILKVHKLNLLLVGEAKEEYSQVLQDALSLIKEQQEDIEKYKTLYERALSDAVKADKIKDLMADYIGKEDVTEIFCNGKIECDENCKICVKQYFERKFEDVKN